MAERFFVVPAHVVGNLDGHGSAQAALEAARAGVEKDKTPRIVIQVTACVKPSPIPRVEVTTYQPVEVESGA